MSKKEEILLRSFMFLPAYSRKFIEKAVVSKADAIILDMEDSVPLDRKNSARKNIMQAQRDGLLSEKKVFIRINNYGTEDFAKDIMELMLPDVDGFMQSKIKSEKDIFFMDKFLGVIEEYRKYEKGKYLLAPLIETTNAINNIYNIAHASERLVALCFGGEDYLNDLGSTYTYQESAFGYPRAMIVNAARSAGILPIDTPYLNVSDLEGFERRGRVAYKNGFAGCLVLNPRQIETANCVFSPDAEKINYSQKLIETIKSAEETLERGVVMFEETLVGPPMKKRAENVIKQKALIDLYEKKIGFEEKKD